MYRYIILVIDALGVTHTLSGEYANDWDMQDDLLQRFPNLQFSSRLNRWKVTH